MGQGAYLKLGFLPGGRAPFWKGQSSDRGRWGYPLNEVGYVGGRSFSWGVDRAGSGAGSSLDAELLQTKASYRGRGYNGDGASPRSAHISQ